MVRNYVAWYIRMRPKIGENGHGKKAAKNTRAKDSNLRSEIRAENFSQATCAEQKRSSDTNSGESLAELLV